MEAVSILVSEGDIKNIIKLINNRGVYYPKGLLEDYTEANVDFLSSIFYNKYINFKRDTFINIKSSNDNFISFGLNHNQEAKLYNGKNNTIEIEFFTKYLNSVNLINTLSIYQFINLNTLLLKVKKFQFVNANNSDNQENSILWDSIVLTNKEDFVLEALRIIEPKVERMTFVDTQTGTTERQAIVKLKDNPDKTPLKSMGDGINRILSIILALVNCENGYFLIDEFENGLHYSIQEKLWEIIFHLSKKLNIQVFATTHSDDCIDAFQKVLNNSENTKDGKMIRLDNKKGIIKPTEINAEEIKIASEHIIELR